MSALCIIYTKVIQFTRQISLQKMDSNTLHCSTCTVKWICCSHQKKCCIAVQWDEFAATSTTGGIAVQWNEFVAATISWLIFCCFLAKSATMNFIIHASVHTVSPKIQSVNYQTCEMSFNYYCEI